MTEQAHRHAAIAGSCWRCCCSSTPSISSTGRFSASWRRPIKADLHLTDAQFGALGGLAFALLYSTLGVPLALLADRTSRTWVITGQPGGVERVHRAVRLGDRASASCSSPASASASARPAASRPPMR